MSLREKFQGKESGFDVMTKNMYLKDSDARDSGGARREGVSFSRPCGLSSDNRDLS